MIKLLLRQPRNVWQTLGWRHKIEIILLAAIVYIYLIGRFHYLFAKWLENESVSLFGLSSLLAHLFILSAFLSAPFILLYLLPRQGGLIPFYAKPLTKKRFFQLTGYFYYKYQIIHLLLFLPLLLALSGLDWLAAFCCLTVFAFYNFLIFFLITEMFLIIQSQFRFLLLALATLFAFHGLYAVFYWILYFPWIFDLIIIMIASLFVWRIYKNLPHPHLELIFPINKRSYRQKNSGKWSFNNLPRFLPKVIQVLFNKEILSLWRNPAYRRLKILTYISYLGLFLILYFSNIENKEIWMTVLTALIIWIHYSNHFNEKYVQPEPDWYFHTLPFRFSQLWTAKFLVEFIYIALLLVSHWIFLIAVQTGFSAQINLIGILLLFSIIILCVMLNFQILFYDNPRLAGYAYHFTIIFLVVMSINYYFVGPIISVFLLIFYFYKSYRSFNS